MRCGWHSPGWSCQGHSWIILGHWTWMSPQRTGLSDQGPERTVFLTLLLTRLLQRLFEHGILVDPLSLVSSWPIWGLDCSPCLGEDVWPFLGIALSLRLHLQLPLYPPSSMRISTLLGLGTDGKECWQSNPERSPHYLGRGSSLSERLSASTLCGKNCKLSNQIPGFKFLVYILVLRQNVYACKMWYCEA